MASSVSRVSHLRPESPLLVYFDLNKWIDLAHAETGTDKGKQHESALINAERWASEGRLIFPLSSGHIMEVAKIGNDTQRRTLARLMAKLSQGWFLASASLADDDGAAASDRASVREALQ